jgi:hypothetical protein
MKRKGGAISISTFPGLKKVLKKGKRKRKRVSALKSGHLWQCLGTRFKLRF